MAHSDDSVLNGERPTVRRLNGKAKLTCSLARLWMLPVLVAGLLSARQGQAQEVTITEDLSIPGHAMNVASHGSTVITYNGVIYFTYVDENLRTKVGMLKNGKWTWTVVEPNTKNDPTHTTPSIGIDAEGYIHAAYNMHGDPWQYSISDRPEDISSFTKIPPDDPRMIPGSKITYPIFIRDNNGVLYVSYRDQPPKTGSGDIVYPELRSGNIAKYDVTKKRWTAIGGGPNVDVAEDNSYGVYKVRLRFDRNNRMHLAWLWRWKVPTGGDAMQPTYAYSDDGGKTFFTARGVQYHLPIDHTQPTSQNAGLAADVSWTDYWVKLNEMRVAIDIDDKPHIVFKDQDKVYKMVQWTGSNWTTPQFWGTLRICINPRGDIFRMYQTYLEISTDNGKTWKRYDYPDSGNYTSFIYDDLYLRETNNLRFQARRKSDNLMKIWTVKLANSGATDSVAPSPPTNVKATLGGN